MKWVNRRGSELSCGTTVLLLHSKFPASTSNCTPYVNEQAQEARVWFFYKWNWDDKFSIVGIDVASSLYIWNASLLERRPVKSTPPQAAGSDKLIPYTLLWQRLGALYLILSRRSLKQLTPKGWLMNVNLKIEQQKDRQISRPTNRRRDRRSQRPADGWSLGPQRMGSGDKWTWEAQGQDVQTDIQIHLYACTS